MSQPAAILGGVNRTDRLYAIVEELRAVSPRPRSAGWLAERFEVSRRTIERDVLALQEAGVPIHAEVGRAGGYVLDAARTLPPLNFTPAEAVEVAAALQRTDGTPLPGAATSALTKMLGAMGPADVAAARRLGGRLVRFAPPQRPGRAPRALEQAILERRVVRLTYADKAGAVTERVVEPHAVIDVVDRWYLAAWCRLREDVRALRLDRIRDVVLTREVAPERNLPPLAIPDLVAAPVLG